MAFMSGSVCVHVKLLIFSSSLSGFCYVIFCESQDVLRWRCYGSRPITRSAQSSDHLCEISAVLFFFFASLNLVHIAYQVGGGSHVLENLSSLSFQRKH